MINVDNNLIIIKGKDKTEEVLSWKYDDQKSVVWITYNNGKTYPYRTNEVEFLNLQKQFQLMKS